MLSRHPKILIKPQNLSQEFRKSIKKSKRYALKSQRKTTDTARNFGIERLPLVHERDEIVRAVESFASSHRSELTIKKKSVDVPCGRFGWRDGSVCVEVANESALIEELESRGLDQYIITKKVLDRSMLVKDRKMLERLGIKGLSYTKGERFYIKINKQVVPEQSTIEPTEVALSPS